MFPRKGFPGWLILLVLWGLGMAEGETAAPKPNVVFILCDNLGYGDLGCYGSTVHRTPNVDRLAREGLKLTGFYASSGVCTPSRASLMTGCYPRRVNMHLSDLGRAVLQPVSPKGLNPEEVTIAEVLKTAGYTTAIIGKWHLGDQLPFLPTRQGFDHFFGIPYSDDMTPRAGQVWPPLPLMRDEKVIEAPVDCRSLTKRYTEESIKFIRQNKDKPFFLLLSHATPGSTSKPEVAPEFSGHSQNGAWGDSVEELDWSTGELLRTLKELKLEENTLIVWTSDNGAPKRNPVQGSNLPLAGWGYTTAEGGMRVPCLIRWPGTIKAGETTDALTTMMDWVPTLAKLSGGKLARDKKIDGQDIWPLLTNPRKEKSPYKSFYYYQGAELQAVRNERWKLYLKGSHLDRTQKTRTEAVLYDLLTDAAEAHDIAAQHPEIVRGLMQAAETAREELGDTDHAGKGQRPAGLVKDVEPRVKPGA
jgi:arylsulfatase A